MPSQPPAPLPPHLFDRRSDDFFLEVPLVIQRDFHVHRRPFRRHALQRAADIAARTAASPREALAACKSCIAAADDPARDGYAEELTQSRRLYASEATRGLVGAFLSGAAH